MWQSIYYMRTAEEIKEAIYQIDKKISIEEGAKDDYEAAGDMSGVSACIMMRSYYRYQKQALEWALGNG